MCPESCDFPVFMLFMLWKSHHPPGFSSTSGLSSCHLQERNALESMRQEFEAELQTARLEVSKAQEALAGSEERVRTAEQVWGLHSQKLLKRVLKSVRWRHKVAGKLQRDLQFRCTAAVLMCEHNGPG